MYKLHSSLFLHPTSTAGGVTHTPTNSADEDGMEKEPSDGDGGQTDKQPKVIENMTQEQFDKIIARTYAKGARSVKKEAAKNSNPQNDGEEAPGKAVPMTKPIEKFTHMSGVGAYWVDEAERIQTSKPTWLPMEMRAHKMGVIIITTKENLRYSVTLLGFFCVFVTSLFYELTLTDIFYYKCFESP